MASKGGAAGPLFCDTNVLVRFLTGEPPDQSRAALRALERAAEGRFTLVLPDLIVAELAYVLTTGSGLDAREAADHLRRVLDLPGIVTMDEAVLRDALSVWAEGRLDFADAYLAALARRFEDAGVLSFDRDLDRVPGVRRVPPG